MTSTEITATGTDAIELARTQGAGLNKYADPTEGARSGLTIEEAEAVAAEDPALIWTADAELF